MAKLILKFAERELQECAVGTHAVSIGRLPDNLIVIDNPAVSGRHARVFREGKHYVVEDLNSTNGTFVNEKPIARHTLFEGDVVLVGRHSLVFSLAGGEQAPIAAGDAERIGGNRVRCRDSIVAGPRRCTWWCPRRRFPRRRHEPARCVLCPASPIDRRTRSWP